MNITDTVSSLGLTLRFVREIFPAVNRELSLWQKFPFKNGDNELITQAQASIRDKKFHCQGGSIYSLYDGVKQENFVPLVVALQTISDYLDNLCDRAGIADEQAFSHLHLAMTDALDPDAEHKDYYKYYPYKNDNGYLDRLVTTCQQQLAFFPAYHIVKPHVQTLAALYSQLQTFKHLDPSIREQKMSAWSAPHLQVYPEISSWEFAAAAGSTLGIFMLCAAASTPALTARDAEALKEVYFPWICGLHILLDYFIDRHEDYTNGDLNFVAYYPSELEVSRRLNYFYQQALMQAARTAQPVFTRTVIDGLLAMYLSDPKTKAPAERQITSALLDKSGSYAKLLYNLCKLLRWRHLL